MSRIYGDSTPFVLSSGPKGCVSKGIRASGPTPEYIGPCALRYALILSATQDERGEDVSASVFICVHLWLLKNGRVKKS